jgi:hypothetical protein
MKTRSVSVLTLVSVRVASPCALAEAGEVFRVDRDDPGLRREAGRAPHLLDDCRSSLRDVDAE